MPFLPSKIVQAVFDAGWTEETLYEAVQVCASFNMMNRIIEGADVNDNYAGNFEAHSLSKPCADVKTHTYGAHGKTVAPTESQRIGFVALL